MYEPVKALYRENIEEFRKSPDNGIEIAEVVSQLRRIHTALPESLDGKQQAQLSQYDEYLNKISALFNEDSFIHGFKLGARLTLESLK